MELAHSFQVAHRTPEPLDHLVFNVHILQQVVDVLHALVFFCRLDDCLLIREQNVANFVIKKALRRGDCQFTGVVWKFRNIDQLDRAGAGVVGDKSLCAALGDFDGGVVRQQLDHLLDGCADY